MSRHAGRSKATPAKIVAAARRARTTRRHNIIGLILVLALASFVTVIVTLKTNEAVQTIGVSRSAEQYRATVAEDGTVIAGEPTAPASLDVYEDFLCPKCGEFEQRENARLSAALKQGKVRISYHLLNMLDRSSVPAGYSGLAANAAIAAAQAGRFADFHASLFAAQPREGGTGYTAEQLIDLGQRLGITGGQFTDQVRGGAYRDKVTAQYDESVRRRVPGTPTVRSGDTDIDLRDAQWLDKLVAAGN